MVISTIFQFSAISLQDHMRPHIMQVFSKGVCKVSRLRKKTAIYSGTLHLYYSATKLVIGF